MKRTHIFTMSLLLLVQMMILPVSQARTLLGTTHVKITNPLVREMVLLDMLLMNNAWACSYPDDPELQKQKDNCTKLSKHWDCSLNRCMSTMEAFNTREDFQKCEKMEDGPAKEQCFMDNAEAKSGVKEGQGGKDDSEKYQKLALMLNIVYALLVIIAMASKSGGGCTSKTIMSIASIAHILTHFMMIQKAKKQFEKMYKEARNMKSTSDYDKQVKALMILRQEQEAIKQYAEKRAKVYKMMIIGYAAAVVMAIVEMIGLFGAKPCGESKEDAKEEGDKGKTEGDQANQGDQAGQGGDQASQGGDQASQGGDQASQGGDQASQGGDQASQGGDQASQGGDQADQAVDNAEASADQTVNDAEKAAGDSVDQADASADKTVENAETNTDSTADAKAGAGALGGALIVINSSLAVMIWAIIAGVLTLKLMKAAEDQAEDAKKNIAKLDETIAMFNEMMEGLCPTGRDSLDNPRCYCYTPDGKENPRRTKSQTCVDLWNLNNKNYFVKSTDYKDKDGPRDGCFNANKQFDPDCKCRKFIDSKTKQNACFKVPVMTTIPATLSSNTGLGNAVNGLHTITGASRSSRLDGNQLSKSATRATRYMDAMLKKYNEEAAKDKKLTPNPVTEQLIEAMAKKYATPEMVKKYGGGMVGSAIDDSRPKDGDLAEQLAKAEEKSGTSRKFVSYEGSGKGGRQKGGKSEKGWNFNMDEGGNGGSGKAMNFEEKADPNYNYKKVDINNDSDKDIFNVISHRYRTSGMRMLFGDDDNVTDGSETGN